jgi:hypothetical protein
MRDDSRNLGPPAVAPFDLPAGWSPSSWAKRNLLGQDKEHSPRGNNSSTQTLAASGSVNPLAQLVLVTGTATATLESAVAADRRWHLFIHDIAAGGTVTVAGTPTINGAASIAISTRYACLMVWSNGTEWRAQQTDLATALGTLALTHGGTGATTAGGARTSLGIDNLLIPLMQWGGYKLDGATNYLDGNALTGIADGKKFTFACVVRFANAASAAERIIHSTGGRFSVLRSAAGKISVTGMDATPVSILDVDTATNVAAAAGTYAIEISADMTTAGSTRIYVNDVSQSLTVNTFTNANIDFTTTEFAIGGSATGTNLMTGDIYYVYLLATNNLELNTESIRRRFVTVDATPVWLGYQGELPSSGIPDLFLAYDKFRTWPRNRGSATDTTFTENGTPADVTTNLRAQAFPKRIITEMSQTFDDDYQITYGNNALSVGTVTIPTGVAVTIPAGSKWMIL